MISTGVRDLKDRLSHYLRLVQKGQQVLVTDHGRVIAEIRPAASELGSLPIAIAALAASGEIRLPLEKGRAFANWPPPGEKMLPPGTAKQLIDEDRGE